LEPNHNREIVMNPRGESVSSSRNSRRGAVDLPLDKLTEE
jgi:hypothetical protein